MSVIAKIRLYGVFQCRLSAEGEPIALGAKTAAMLALLVTAPGGVRTRSWLQETLWPLSGPEHGRASVRQTLAGLKKSFGDDFDSLFAADKGTIAIQLDRVGLEGDPADGEFLEGMDIAGSEGFESWLRQKRQMEPARVTARARPLVPVDHAAFARLRPAMAVVPLAVVSGQPEMGSLGDLIANDISRHLARLDHVDVMSHLSCRSDAFRSSTFHHLRQKYDVDFLVTGHARVSGDRVALDVDIIHVDTARILASDRFQDSLDGTLSGASPVYGEICAFLYKAAFESTIQICADREPTDLPAFALLMSAIVLMHRQDRLSVQKSRNQIDLILKRYPSSALVLAWSAYWRVLYAAQGWSRAPSADARDAVRDIEAAVDANPTCRFSRVIHGLVQYQIQKDFEAARASFDLVTREDGNNSFGWLMRGNLYAFEGNGPEAVRFTRRAMRLSPNDPGHYLYATICATASLAAEDFGAALDMAEDALRLNPNHLSSLRTKIIALHNLGRGEDARGASARLMRQAPDFTVRQYLRTHAAGRFDTGRRWAEALGASGIPMN